MAVGSRIEGAAVHGAATGGRIVGGIFGQLPYLGRGSARRRRSRS